MTPLKLHQLFVGPVVTETQTSFVSNPKSHGVSSKENNPDNIDATIVLAISRVASNGAVIGCTSSSLKNFARQCLREFT